MDFSDIDEELSRMAESANDPSLDQPQTAQPQTTQRRPEDNPLVRAYIARLSQADQPDPELQRLNQQAQVREMFQHPGGSAMDRRISAALSGNAGAHDPMAGSATPPPDPYAPVKAYIQQKQDAQAQKEHDLGQLEKGAKMQRELAQADKAERDSSDDMLKLKRDALLQRQAELAARIKHGDATLEEQQRWHDMSAQLRELNSRILGSIASTRAGTLDLKKDQYADTLGQETIPTAESQEHTVAKPVSKELNDKIAASRTVLGTLDKIKELEREHRMGILAPSDAQAQIQARMSELGPQWNSAQSKLSYVGPRADAIKHALSDPQSISATIKDVLTGGGYTKTNLAEVEKIIEEGVRNAGTSQGVTLGPKIGEPVPGGPKIRHGSKYARTPGERGESSDSRQVTITDAKDGKSVTISADKASEFMFDHGDKKINGKQRFTMSNVK